MENTYLQLQTAQKKQQNAEYYAIATGLSTSVIATKVCETTTTWWRSSPNALTERTDWDDKESRQAYMEACVEQDIAWQININRKARDLTQKQLAEKINTTQTAIARLEDPCYGRHSIGVLIKLANAFDCALMVRLIPYSKLAEITKDTSDNAYIAVPYESEIQKNNDSAKCNRSNYGHATTAKAKEFKILSGETT